MDGLVENKLKEKIVGKKIADCTFTSIKLEDGTEIEWRIEGSLGADDGWYPFLMIYFNGEKIAQL